MTPTRATARPLHRSMRLYASGHAALIVGAWAMNVSGSMWPMALAASASLMLTVPIVRHLIAPRSSRRL